MQHDEAKERQEASLLGRLFSLEAALLLMGIASLVYGLVTTNSMNIFFGLVIVPGVFVLNRVKKKDWKAHWAALEEAQRREQERRRDGR